MIEIKVSSCRVGIIVMIIIEPQLGGNNWFADGYRAEIELN
jgi:hypothetical protein